MAHVQLNQVSKSYDGQALAVQPLDLVFAQGEMLALLGPSGCGKSSTLKMVAGIEPVSTGSILFDGVDVTHRDSAARNIAMVFEDYALYPHMSVFENIAFPLRVRRVASADIVRKVREMVEMLGLEAFQQAPVRTLSGGAQQRVSIGRALVRDPALVMFDEPLSHLDADQKVLLRTEIRRLQATAGLTSVLVTHDQTEAMAMADRIAVMDHGALQQVGSPRELYEQPANIFVAGFIGDSPMNLFDAHVDGQGLVHLDKVPMAGVALGRAQLFDSAGLVLGIRPEDIRLQPPANEPALILRACVIDRECCGDRDVLLALAGERRFNVEVPSPASLNAGDGFDAYFPLSRLHGFDALTGLSLNLERLPC